MPTVQRWTIDKVDDDGKSYSRTAVVDVDDNNLVLVHIDLMAQMLTELGLHKEESLWLPLLGMRN